MEMCFYPSCNTRDGIEHPDIDPESDATSLDNSGCCCDSWLSSQPLVTAAADDVTSCALAVAAAGVVSLLQLRGSRLRVRAAVSSLTSSSSHRRNVIFKLSSPSSGCMVALRTKLASALLVPHSLLLQVLLLRVLRTVAASLL